MNSRARSLLFPTCLLLAVTTAGADTPAPLPPIPTQAQRDALRKGGSNAPLLPGPQSPGQLAADANQDLFDVTRYFLDLEFIPSSRTVTGSVTISATSLGAGLTHVVLDLFDNLTVSQVVRGTQPLSFSRGSNLLDVTLDRSFGAGEPFEIKVTYSGVPESTGFGSFGWNKYIYPPSQKNMAWSLSEPDGARTWWPSKDRPDDKAMVEEWWTVPSTWIATGNGKLIGTENLANSRKRYKWKPTHPLTSYLVSVAATNYVKVTDTYTPLAGGSMPVEHYVYSELRTEAQESFKPTPQMIGFYAQKFGEYPFVEDKYGHSTFPFSGAMEHSTNTSYGYLLVDGGHGNDYVIAHELSHQWWGDSVSPQTWRDVWLNEGFASYSESLWAEQIGGFSNYKSYMNSFYRSSFDGPVYNPLDLFGTTVYDKGAWVNHMSRWVLGDTAFFLAWRDWYAAHKDGVGNTAQYQATLEARHGASLQWFFDQWVYGVNSPNYEYGFAVANRGAGAFRTTLRVRQIQTNAGLFRMPLQVTLVLPSGNQRRTVDNNQPDQDFTFDTAQAPTDVLFDEDNWVLKVSAGRFVLDDADADGVPDRNDNCVTVANGAQGDADLDTLGDACDPDDDNDSLADTLDCAPLDPSQGRPGEVAALDLQDHVTLLWTSLTLADGYDLSRGALSPLASTQDYGACLATGLTQTVFSDLSIPAAGDGYLYLVRARDAGCGGPGTFGARSDGSERPALCP